MNILEESGCVSHPDACGTYHYSRTSLLRRSWVSVAPGVIVTGLPPDHTTHIGHLAALIRRWCRDHEISPGEETELSKVLLIFVLESPFCRRRLRGLCRELGTPMESEGRSIVGLVMARHPQNRLAIILGEVLDADDATLLAECRSRVRTAAANDAFHQLQSTDPNGYKILKSLSDALHGRPDLFVLLPDSGNPTHVTTVRDGQIRASSPEVTVEDLLRLLPEICSRYKYMPDRVAALLSIVAGETQWCAVVPIATLFESVRSSTGAAILSGAEANPRPTELPPLLKLAIDRAACKAREAYRARLARNITDGHIMEREGQGIRGAIEAIVEECICTGRWPGEMKEYLRHQIVNLTEEEYDSRYKARFQYLVGMAKSTFFSTLEKEYVG